MKIKFIPQEYEFNKFLEILNTFGKIYLPRFMFRDCPKNIDEKRAYSLSGEQNNIITKTGSNGIMGTICEQELDKSKEEHKWKIKILKAKSQAISVGVAPIDFDIYSSKDSTCGWYLYCNGCTLYSGPPFNYKGKNTNLSKVNDEIIVIMNVQKRSLKFIINNEDKGDSFINIPIDKPLFPAVCLFNKEDCVEIT